MVQTVGGMEGWLNRELIWPAGHVVGSGQEVAGAVIMDAKEDAVTSRASEPAVQEHQAENIPVEADEAGRHEVRDSIARADEVRVVSDEPEEMLAKEEVELEASVISPASSEIVEIKASENVQKFETGSTDLKSYGEYAGVAQNGKGANVRSEPSLASDVLRSVAPGYPLAVLKRWEDWVLVEDYRERKGWVFASLLSDLKTVVIKVGKGNLRNGPTLVDEIVAKLDYGAIMFVEQKEGEWLQVRNSEGVIGWLHQDIVWP